MNLREYITAELYDPLRQFVDRIGTTMVKAAKITVVNQVPTRENLPVSGGAPELTRGESIIRGRPCPS